MNVLLVTSDLMVQSRITAAATRVGVPAPRIVAAQDLTSLDEERCFDQVLIDLTAPGMDVAALVPALRERFQQTQIIAFGPHVHTAKLSAARQVGCDLVISRGQLDRDIEQILAR